MLEEKDIGKRLISFVTSGLYPDPLDAIREYIQNAIDGEAKQVNVNIEDNKIVIEDNGVGMTKQDVQNSAKLAISDKNPIENIGYKGIGIYSALSLVDHLRLESWIEKNELMQILEINFGGIISDIENDDIDLLSKVLTKNINFAEEPKGKQPFLTGSRIILSDINNKFKQSLKDEENTIGYLESTIPLEFYPQFEHREEIENKINEYLKQANNSYRTIKLALYYNGKPTRALYKPYTEDHKCQAPRFIKIESKESDRIFGYAWGCMASKRGTFSSPRGFFLKKHGITIGNENTILQHFHEGTKFFNRYIGEFIILDDDIQPNAARSDIEISEHSSEFFEAIKAVSRKFEKSANIFQETNKAEEKITKIRKILIEAKSEKPLSEESFYDLQGKMEKLEDRMKNPAVEDYVKDKLKNLISDIKKFLSRSKPNVVSEGHGIIHNQKISDKINEFQNNAGTERKNAAKKIQQLYNSLCKVSPNAHTLFCYMGAEAFFEVLAKIANSKETEGSDLDKYIKAKIRNSSYKDKDEMQNAWAHIRAFGHEAKHSISRFPEKGDQLRQDMETLEPLILDLLDEILAL